jgi:hypothetical protein
MNAIGCIITKNFENVSLAGRVAHSSDGVHVCGDELQAYITVYTSLISNNFKIRAKLS